MNPQFDELAKGLAQAVTRRSALKKFGLGVTAMVFASLGLVNQAQANGSCNKYICDCSMPYAGCNPRAGDFYKCIACCGPRC